MWSNMERKPGCATAAHAQNGDAAPEQREPEQQQQQERQQDDFEALFSRLAAFRERVRDSDVRL